MSRMTGTCRPCGGPRWPSSPASPWCSAPARGRPNRTPGATGGSSAAATAPPQPTATAGTIASRRHRTDGRRHLHAPPDGGAGATGRVHHRGQRRHGPRSAGYLHLGRAGLGRAVDRAAGLRAGRGGRPARGDAGPGAAATAAVDRTLGTRGRRVGGRSRHGRGGPGRDGSRSSAPASAGTWGLQVEITFGGDRRATWYWSVTVAP